MCDRKSNTVKIEANFESFTAVCLGSEPFNLVIVFIGTDLSNFLCIRRSSLTLVKLYFSRLTLALAKLWVTGYYYPEWEAEGSLGAGFYRNHEGAGSIGGEKVPKILTLAQTIHRFKVHLSLYSSYQKNMSICWVTSYFIIERWNKYLFLNMWMINFGYFSHAQFGAFKEKQGISPLSLVWWTSFPEFLHLTFSIFCSLIYSSDLIAHSLFCLCLICQFNKNLVTPVLEPHLTVMIFLSGNS